MPGRHSYILDTRAKARETSTLLYRDRAAVVVEPRIRIPARELGSGGREHRSPNSDRVSMLNALRQFIGQWVAVRGNTIIASGDSPRSVITSVRGRGLRADSVFRVPSDAREDKFGEL